LRISKTTGRPRRDGGERFPEASPKRGARNVTREGTSPKRFVLKKSTRGGPKSEAGRFFSSSRPGAANGTLGKKGKKKKACAIRPRLTLLEKGGHGFREGSAELLRKEGGKIGSFADRKILDVVLGRPSVAAEN